MIDLLLNPEEIILQEESHVYLKGEKQYSSVSTIIRQYGLGDDFSYCPPAALARAQDRGNKVHMACRFIDEDDLVYASVDPAIRGYVDAYIKFRKECVIKVVCSERKMVSEQLGFGGTPDLVCFISGHRSIVDRKTSQILGKSVGVQLAAYQLLWQCLEGTVIYDRYGLKLDPTGNYRLIEYDAPEDLIVFQDALRFDHELKIKEKWNARYK